VGRAVTLEEFLRMVQSGQTKFLPNGKDLNSLAAFQTVAEIAEHAADHRLVEQATLHYESWSGQRYCDLVTVHGLTPEGLQVLQNPPLSHQ
jgi:hypothetical protein